MKSFLKGLGCFTAVLVSILFFIYLTLFTIVKVSNSFLTKDGIKSYITKIDLINLPAGSIIGDNNTLEVDKDATVKNILKDSLESANISKDLMNKLMNNKDIDNAINNYVSEIVIAKIYNNPVSINSDELLKALNKSNIEITNEDKTYIDNFFEEFSDEFNADLSNEEAEIKPILDAINIVNTKYFSLYLILGFILFAGIISLLRWCCYSFLNYMGIPAIVLGIILLIIFALKEYIIILLSFDEGVKTLINTLLNPIYNNILTLAIIYMVVGILGIIIHGILQSKKRRKLNIKIIDEAIEKAQ